MELRFSGEVWFWRGPSPFHFVTVPASESQEIRSIAPSVTYGWGMIPCHVSIGTTRYKTSLWPKDGGYILPIKAAVRIAENIEVTDVVNVKIDVD